MKSVILIGIFMGTLIFGCTSSPPNQSIHDPTSPSHSSGGPSGMSISPSSSTTESIYENCGDDEDMVREGLPTSEVGIAVPIDRKDGPAVRGFTRYKCKNGNVQ